MIAGCEQVNPGLQKLISDLGRDPKSCGSILDVGHAKIDAAFVDQGLKLILEYPPAWFAEYITYKQNSHFAIASGQSFGRIVGITCAFCRPCIFRVGYLKVTVKASKAQKQGKTILTHGNKKGPRAAVWLNLFEP